MGDLSDCGRGQIFGARLAGASVTKIAKLSGVSRATVSTVVSAYMNRGKTSPKGKQWVKIKTGRKRLSYIAKDCLEKSQNYYNTGDRRTEYSSRRPFRKNPVQREFHQSSIHGRAAIAKFLIIEINTEKRKRWCHNHKTWTSDNWKRARDMVN
jgi:hypothetical protein